MTIYRIGDKVRLTNGQGSLIGFITEVYGGDAPDAARQDGYFTVTAIDGVTKRVSGGEIDEVLADPSFAAGDKVLFEGAECEIAGQSGRSVRLKIPGEGDGLRDVPVHEVVLHNRGEQARN